MDRRTGLWQGHRFLYRGIQTMSPHPLCGRQPPLPCPPQLLGSPHHAAPTASPGRARAPPSCSFRLPPHMPSLSQSLPAVFLTQTPAANTPRASHRSPLGPCMHPTGPRMPTIRFASLHFGKHQGHTQIQNLPPFCPVFPAASGIVPPLPS